MQARRLPALSGAQWLLAGFRLFRRNPPLLSALTLGYLVLVLGINMLPWIGPLLLAVVLPSLAVVVANGCRFIDGGEAPGTPALWGGLAEHREALLRLGGLHLAGSMLILALSLLVEGGAFPWGAEALPEEEIVGALARLLVIASPVLMAFWFAPLLVGWNGVPAAKAVFFSFVAVWRNWRAFLAYGLAVAIIAVVAPALLLILAGQLSQGLLNVLSIALRMLLLFVLAPMLMASVYLSYKDVFHGASDDVSDAP